MTRLLPDVQLVGTVFILVGFVLISIGVCLRMNEDLAKTDDSQTEMRSRGVIFIGPIPIVWGFGRWNIVAFVILLIFLVWGLLLLS